VERIEQFDAAMQEEYWTVLQAEARGMMERLLNRAMDLERMAFLGVAPYERHPARRGRRNGFDRRVVDSRWGPLRLRLPKVRGTARALPHADSGVLSAPPAPSGTMRGGVGGLRHVDARGEPPAFEGLWSDPVGRDDQQPGGKTRRRDRVVSEPPDPAGVSRRVSRREARKDQPSAPAWTRPGPVPQSRLAPGAGDSPRRIGGLDRTMLFYESPPA